MYINLRILMNNKETSIFWINSTLIHDRWNRSKAKREKLKRQKSVNCLSCKVSPKGRNYRDDFFALLFSCLFSFSTKSHFSLLVGWYLYILTLVCMCVWNLNWFSYSCFEFWLVQITRKNHKKKTQSVKSLKAIPQDLKIWW